MSETRDALNDLQRHPGWLAFRAHVEQEWGAQGVRYHQEMDKALDLTDPAQAASQARQIRAARRMVEQLLAWPAEEVQRLDRAEAPAALTGRRGGY